MMTLVVTTVFASCVLGADLSSHYYVNLNATLQCRYSSPPYSRRLCAKTPSKYLKAQIVPNPIYTMFFPIHTYL